MTMRNPDRGAAAVEFALVLPVLLLLVFGIVDFARAYNAQITLSEAAAQGVRTLAVGGTTAQAETAVRNSLQGSAVPAGDITFSNESSCTGTNTKATITVTDNNFALVTPVPTFLGIPNTLTLSAVGARQCGS